MYLRPAMETDTVKLDRFADGALKLDPQSPSPDRSQGTSG